jgi:hypothetical protein
MTGLVMVTKGGGCGGKGGKGGKSSEEEQNQLSLAAVLVAALRKSMVACRVDRGDDVMSTVHHMEIGWPTNVQHITHVTFDRFNGFLGLPVEFEVEIPGRVPSARYQLLLLFHQLFVSLWSSFYQILSGFCLECLKFSFFLWGSLDLIE